MRAAAGGTCHFAAPMGRDIRWWSCVAVFGLLMMSSMSLTTEAAVTSPLPSQRGPVNLINTTAPAVNATIDVVAPPDTTLNTSMLSNSSLSFVGFGNGMSLFNASFPVPAVNTTVPPLRTFNTSVASLLPSGASQNVSQNGSNTLLIPDPSWGAAILVNASALRNTQLVASNSTQTASTAVFTTVYNTTTVQQNTNTTATPWQHSVCTATFEQHSSWQVSNHTFNASASLVIRSTSHNDTPTPWTLAFTSAGGYTAAQSTYGLADTTVTAGFATGKATSAEHALQSQGGNAPSFDFILSSAFPNFDPVNVTVNGESCAVIIDSNVTTQPLPNITASNTSGNAETESAAGLTTSNGQITDLNGNILNFKGLNWFGFDDGNTGPDGLWAGSTSLTLDFANIVLRIKALGFNAVRLPFSFKDLNKPMQSFARSCRFVSGSDIAASTVPSGTSVAAGSNFPSLSSPPQRTQTLGVCSDYLDVGTTFNRLVYVVKLLTHNGIYVLLDNQFNLDTTVLDNQSVWLADWLTLLRAVAQDPISASMLMVDVLNEPDVFGLRWEAANGKPGYADLCIRLMDAAYPIVPNALFFVEGTAQYAAGYDGLAFNWGDGLATGSDVRNQYRGISDAGLFFEQVLSKPYVNQVVAAPHIYPPSITGAHTKYTGAGLFTRLSQSFGYLNKQGYCSRSNGNNCHRFPVVIGETGTNFNSQADRDQMNDFALYLNAQGQGNDGQHNAIGSWFWWAWNANSGDTGGIVESDWTTINWNKINYMIGIGLNPWYRGGRSSTPAPVSGGCSDVAPPSSSYTCAQQAGWGKCNEAFMSGYCQNSCNRCGSTPAAPVSTCSDVAPNNQYTCAQQAGWGKCNEAFMSGYCQQSCKRCGSTPAAPVSTCSDVAPNNQYTCAQQAGWGKCNEAFMSGYCQQSCNRCGSTPAAPATTCSDIAPNSLYTCAQQASWGKCNEGFMSGYCLNSCNRCGSTPAATCSDVAPNNLYTCAQQAGWGKCNEAFMSGYCQRSCNRCGSAPAAATCSDTPPNGQYTCAQQAGWGKCNEAFMLVGNYCQKTCGRCSSCTDVAPSGQFTCAQQVSFGKCSESWMTSENYCQRSCGRC